MKKLAFLFTIMLGYITIIQAQIPQKEAISQLEDIMDISDLDRITSLLLEQRNITKLTPNTINKVRLGILYHDVALKSLSRNKAERRYYTEEAYRMLTNLSNDLKIEEELKPFVKAYQASVLALLGAERNNSQLVNQAFGLFEQAMQQYGHFCYAPQYLRARVAEQLPRSFGKRRMARKDYSELIDRYGLDCRFATYKSMSYVYWAWAKLHNNKKNKKQLIRYLEQSIKLDRTGEAAGARAKLLLEELNGPYKNVKIIY